MAKRITLCIVANNAKWVSWPQKISSLGSWFSAKVHLDTTLKHVSFSAIPFQPAENGPGFYRVLDSWYNTNVSALAKEFDVVLFVIPKKQWPDPNNAWGYRTDRDSGPIEIQISCDENSIMYTPNATGRKDEYGNNVSDAFFEQARHEILHALFMLTGQTDSTHKWIADYNKAEMARDELVFPEEATPEPPLPAWIALLPAWLAAVAMWLRTDRTAAPPKLPDGIIAEPKPVPPPKPHSRIPEWALAIQHAEGFYGPGQNANYPKGTASFRHNNPGNLKYTTYTASLGAKKGNSATDGGSFCYFDSYDAGFKALCQFLRHACTNVLKPYRSTDSLDKFSTTYANPPSKNYVTAIGRELGVPITTPIGSLL